MVLFNKEISKADFYYILLAQMNALNRKSVINEKVLKLGSYLMSLENGERFFNYNKDYEEPLPGCSYQEVTRVKKELLKLNLLKEVEPETKTKQKRYKFTKVVSTLPDQFKLELILNVKY